MTYIMDKITLSSLDSTETAIYKAALEGGRLTLAGIAKATNRNRTSLYPYVASLLEKGYLVKTVTGKRQYYSAANPEKIHVTLKKQLEGFESQLPFLLDIYSRAKKQPTIEVFEGKEAIFRAFKQAYQEAFYVKTFFEFEKFASIYNMQTEGNELFKILREQKFPFQGLASNSEASRKFIKTYKDEGFSARFMPPGITFPAEFFIYNQKVLIVSYERMFAVLIESEDITTFLKTLFDYFWKQAGR